ncbi:fatty acid-binding protein, liver-like [Saccostrea echinata]|uniref:fatty acid-binding protein, liver-like n=1 Tax=Saccostrea echinata TaxID=191078 RepID=UPI002A82A960|nr:fatty acid-binding protein, liver-like [Saccostrea echinata]
MSKFNGTWEDRELDPSYEAFMDAIGLGEYKEKYRGARTTLTYEVNGENWKITWLTSLYPDNPMTCDIQIGKEFDTKGPDGSDVKATFTVISDCEIKEHEITNTEDGKNREFIITRKVNGDIMDVTMEAVTSKATMKGKMYRKK